MSSFTAQRGAVRIVFATGASGSIRDELARLGATRPLWVCTSRSAAQARDLAGDAPVLDTARQHVPGDVADAAAARARELGADVVVGFGGGSPIGLAKAIALACDGVRVAAVPTTYAGSEMTAIYGVTRDGRKTTGRDERVRPVLVVYDPALTHSLPVATSIASAINAMAHAVEALYADGVDDALRDEAEASVAAIGRAVPRLAADPTDAAGRADALYGAYLAGASLGVAAMGVHHKLCHVLGGSFGLPHAETHTVVLPHAVRFNADAAPQAIARVARALGVDDAANGLWDLARDAGAPTDLASLGLRASDLDRAADLATASAYPNPRPVERDAIRILLERALAGQRPIEPIP